MGGLLVGLRDRLLGPPTLQESVMRTLDQYGYADLRNKDVRSLVARAVVADVIRWFRQRKAEREKPTEEVE